MGVQKCPGQDRRYWNPEDINEMKCPVCGASVELWKDEGITKCRGCGFEIRNPKVELGCAQWCKFAVECIGYKPQDQQEEITIRDRLISAMRETLFPDKERIVHTLKVLDWAEKLVMYESGSPITVKAAAILHEVEEAPEGTKTYGSHSTDLGDFTGSRIQQILEDMGVGNTISRGICEIITQFHQGNEMDIIEFKIFSDAHLLSEIEEHPDGFFSGDSESFIHNRFKTEYAKKLAKELWEKPL